LAPERLAQFEAMMATIIKDGQVVYESKYTDTQGNLNWFIVNGKRVVDKTPRMIGICLSVHDITIRKQAEEQIKELNAGLEDRVMERTLELTEANKALEAFSYSVSHDLRAPVRAVMSFTKIIQKDYSDKMEPELKELFDYIENGSTRMMAIITDLLKLAKYGKEKLKFEPVNMGQLVKNIWLNITRTHPHQAIMELAELPVVQADMSMMEQVIINLISNAIKYSSKKEKPVVTIWYEQAEENLTFYFQDNGAGFDMKNHDRLFGAFQRLHSANEFEGTGVGLTLVKSIIEKHEGTVGAEAKVGEGATFCFTLPMQ
jgi:light-regulated signal transduction histidine kinase (bacteriophytochrome)